MADLPVVAVVATHGEDRLGLLTGRALPSIAKQTTKADLVIVVSDNDPLNEFLDESDIKSCFEPGYQDNVRLINNNRTRGNSGTGAWNSGIFSALSTVGIDCWISILDDDDEWEENHIEVCLEAANNGSCQWVASGIVRVTQNRKNENLPTSKPKASEFFTTNPGIQGSNLFVRVSALLGKSVSLACQSSLFSNMI